MISRLLCSSEQAGYIPKILPLPREDRSVRTHLPSKMVHISFQSVLLACRPMASSFPVLVVLVWCVHLSPPDDSVCVSPDTAGAEHHTAEVCRAAGAHSGGK